jgi:hypothetical protein
MRIGIVSEICIRRFPSWGDQYFVRTTLLCICGSSYVGTSALNVCSPPSCCINCSRLCHNFVSFIFSHSSSRSLCACTCSDGSVTILFLYGEVLSLVLLSYINKDALSPSRRGDSSLVLVFFLSSRGSDEANLAYRRSLAGLGSSCNEHCSAGAGRPDRRPPCRPRQKVDQKANGCAAVRTQVSHYGSRLQYSNLHNSDLMLRIV